MRRPDESGRSKSLQRIVIVGGGTAGWLSAATLAARLPSVTDTPPGITLIESPDIPTVGVGEGTWPTMRSTLAAIGIPESEFLELCGASFKQGSRFDGWRNGTEGDTYLHPFTAPPDMAPRALIAAWQNQAAERDFASAVTAQAELCAHQLAPRQRSMQDYAGAVNYGYHLDAAKLGTLLARHAVDRLGVVHVQDQVEAVEAGGDGRIAAVRTRGQGSIAGDLFIDCTGHAALLIGGHFAVDWIDRSDILFNDRALAVQVPVAPNSAIASATIATAHEAGWLWDIGLPARRGIGCVYSSRYIDDDRAEAILRNYIVRAGLNAAPSSLTPRKLSFPTGHREKFWAGNCIALGLAAGFIEPLEATAIVLVEMSLRALVDNFPASVDAMAVHSRRFNRLFRERWDRIVDFLKLHYVLSERTEPYWQSHRDPVTSSPKLIDLLELWRDQPPSAYDFPLVEEMFPAASHQYVYYGMGGTTAAIEPAGAAMLDPMISQRARSLAAAMPTNRAYLDALHASFQNQEVQTA